MVHVLGEARPLVGPALPHPGSRLAWVCAVSLGWVLALSGAAQGGADTDDKSQSPESILASRGLQLVDKKYLLDSEAQAGERFRQAQPEFARLHTVATQLMDILYNDARLAELNVYSLGLIRDLEVMRIEMDSYPPYRNRWTSLQMAVYNQSLAMRTELNSIQREIDTRRGSVPSPRDRDTLVSDMKKLRESCLERVRELTELFDSISAHYRELANDKTVLVALQAMKRAKGMNLQLGPSDEFRNAQHRLLAAKNDLDRKPKQVAPRQRPKRKTANKTAGY